jgi:acetate---CoA ligase (ADP-forming)
MTALSDEQEHTHTSGNEVALRPPGTASPAPGDAVRAMLEARSVALVGASPRPGTFGSRMLEEAGKSGARPRLYPVNPRYAELDGRRCYPSLAELPEAPELALLAVPDAALEEQLILAAEVGSRSAVIFGNAHEGPVPGSSPGPGEAGAGGAGAGVASAGVVGAGVVGADLTAASSPPGLRERLAAIARDAGMALCGAGCMGFANVTFGLRALGYTEPDPLPAGPVALVTHSGSVFSAMLRTRRGIGFTLAVSSGQELVTGAPGYLDYALSLPDTTVVGLVLEAIRDGVGLRRVLAAAADRDVPVVLLTVGSSVLGRSMVAAHSGALAGSDGGWEALARAYGVHRVTDLAEFTDTLELFALGRCARPAIGASPAASADPRSTDTEPAAGTAGIATVHDSGLERAHVVDLADALGVPFAEIGAATTARLADLLDPGLIPANPLDVWGTGAETRDLFGGSLLALAADPAVQAVALAVDLVPELDGDESYPLALLDVAGRTGKPLAVLSNLSSAIDSDLARQLRGQGIPVLEGTRSGLLALRHLLDHARPVVPSVVRRVDRDRQARGRALLRSGEANGAALLGLLAEYGIGVAPTVAAASLDGVLRAAGRVGYPVALKTGEPEILHKSDIGGVVLGIASPEQLAAAYGDLASRLGPRALVCQTVPAGTELALGLVADPQLGSLVVVGGGGVLVELLADRAVALPPVSADQATELLSGLRVSRLLAGVRGREPADRAAVAAAVAGLSELAVELGDDLEALDINPLICGPGGAVAVDALAIPRVTMRGGPAGTQVP